MPTPNDNLNLLSERDRKEGDAAVKRAAKPTPEGEVRLVMPQVKKEPEKPSMLKRLFGKKSKDSKAAPSATASAVKPAEPSKPTVSVSVAPKPAPVSKPSMPAPKPPMPEPAKPRPVVAEPTLTPLKKEAPKTTPTMEKLSQAKPPIKAGAKLHEPEKMAGVDGKSSSLGVNLVSEAVISESEGTPWGIYAGALVVVLGIWIALTGYAFSRAKQAEAKISETNAALSQLKSVIKDYESDKSAHLALQKQFLLVKDMVNNHVYWTPFLQKLEETTIPDVYYLGATANRNGDVTLRAVAKNYSAAARQIRAFERASSFITSVQVNQARQELEKGSSLPVPVIAFDVQLKLNNGIFTINAPEEASPVSTPDTSLAPAGNTAAVPQPIQPSL